MLTFNLDEDILEEIISQLAKLGRRDLIEELYEAKDEDYKPPFYVKKEKYSEDEGSASSEEDYSFSVDDNGFHSLK